MWQNRESHIKDETCPIYSDIWQKYGDLNNDEDLVNFFYEVLEKRSKLEFLKMNEDEAPPPAVGDANTAMIANLSFPRQASLAVIHFEIKKYISSSPPPH